MEKYEIDTILMDNDCEMIDMSIPLSRISFDQSNVIDVFCRLPEFARGWFAQSYTRQKQQDIPVHYLWQFWTVRAMSFRDLCDRVMIPMD